MVWPPVDGFEDPHPRHLVTSLSAHPLGDAVFSIVKQVEPSLHHKPSATPAPHSRLSWRLYAVHRVGEVLGEILHLELRLGALR